MPLPSERAEALRKEASGHKRAVRLHRDRLRACMEELARIERVNDRLGISTEGEEVTHGQENTRSIHG